MTESSVASTSVIRLSTRASLPLSVASLVRVVVSATGERAEASGIAIRARQRVAVLAERTELVEELGELLDAELHGLRELSLLPVPLHTSVGHEG